MARKKLRTRRPKTLSSQLKANSHKNKATQKLALPTVQFANRLSPKIIFIVLVLFILAALGKTALNKPNVPSKNTETPQSSLDSNPEAAEKLKEVYEKERGISLGEFAPRYSIFENADYGYRFAYPVGYNYSWQGESVYLTPKSNKGKVVVTGKNGSFEVKADTNGASETEAQALQATAEFIRQTFEFSSSAKSGTQERFDTSEGPVYRY